MLKLTAQTGELLEASIAETRRLVVIARRRARGRGAKAKLKAAAQLEQLADRCEKVAAQIKQRVAGEPITDRLVSLSDPDARPIRKGKLGKPNEFGYVSQLCEVTENTRRGARGLILPAGDRDREPGRGHAAARHRRRAQAARDLPERGRARRRLQRRPDQRGASKTSHRTGCSSPAANNPAPNAPNDECRSTEPAPKDGSATSNAATAWTDPASKATKASRSGTDGRSSPTTLTRSPSGSGETLPASSNRSPLTTNRPRPRPARPFHFRARSPVTSFSSASS